MLKELSIRNFAIIDDLHIRLEPGLTVLSGETGAGKTIIINAVNLILGARASADMIRTGAEAAEVEALFAVGADSAAGRAAREAGYDPGEGLIVRRVISRADGNRVYVNGRLATLQLLSAVTDSLASISGQHAHQRLLKEDQHLILLDQFAGLAAEREAVAELVRQIVPELRRLNELAARQARQAEAIELLQFQRQEIEAAGLHAGEDRELEQERQRLRHAGALHEAVEAAVDALYGGPGAAAERIGEVRRSLEKMVKVDPLLSAHAEACAEAAYRLEDVVAGLRDYLRTVDLDEARLEEVEARLDLINRLKRKHGGSLEAVLARLEESAAELAGLERIAEEIEALTSRLAGWHAQASEQALALSKKRRKAAERFTRKVAAELAGLRMEGTRLGVQLTQVPAAADADPHMKAERWALTETGVDRAVLTIAPNVGEALKPLAAIASGGELSRVVLALKSILADTESVATIVFDEVDAGIGGAVAEVVGRKLAEIATRHQVLCITHLPQIARFGTHHFRISKDVVDGRARTDIALLSPAERTREIARMLGGEKITRVTLEHAREMLSGT
jgi:DNA repair protein RecN (Recombination protein N)